MVMCNAASEHDHCEAEIAFILRFTALLLLTHSLSSFAIKLASPAVLTGWREKGVWGFMYLPCNSDALEILIGSSVAHGTLLY